MLIRPRGTLISLLVVMATLAGVDSVIGEPLPASRRTDWTYTGVPGGIPHRTNICATFSVGVTAAQINTALAGCSASGGGVVKLASGKYDITGIKIFYDNVTLRGEGANNTILRNIGGTSILTLGVGLRTASGIALTGGGAKDSRTFTVASVAGLAVNQMIELERENNSDYVVSTKPTLAEARRMLRQVNLITAIAGAGPAYTITVKNPLFIDFTTGDPKIKFTYSSKRLSGVEDLKLDYSMNTSNQFMLSDCYACWLKGVESYKSVSYHVQLMATLNLEVRDSYIHDAQTYGNRNGGLVIGSNNSYIYGSNSSGKIENTIFDRVFPGIVLQYSASGFYIGYNYFYSSMSSATAQPVTWVVTDNHGPHDTMNLWEGNTGELFGSDGYYGGSSHGTIARNYWTGYHPVWVMLITRCASTGCPTTTAWWETCWAPWR